MKKLLLFSLVTVVALCFAMPVMAQIYKYTTDAGQTFYTNDPNQVPPEYRNQVEYMYETVPDGTKTTPQTPAGGNNTAPQSSPYANPDLEAQRAKLEAEKGQLEALYADLTARRATMEEERQSLSVDNQDAMKAFNDRIIQLNKEVEDYKTRTNAYNAELREFNLKVMEQSDTQP